MLPATNRTLFRFLVILAVTSVAGTLLAQGGAFQVKLAPPGRGQLAGADLTESGRMLLAWKDSGAGWSQIQVLADGRETESWDLPGELVQGVRWTPGGRMLVASVVADEGPEQRLYELGPKGRLSLRWSSRDLSGRYDHATLDASGTTWLGTTFSTDSAHVAVGRVGQTRPLHEWTLDAEQTGRPGPMELEEYTYGFFLAGTSNPFDVGILWGARLWLAGPDHQPVELTAPQGCREIQTATSTSAGLWVQCYRGMEARPSHSWALYSDAGPGAGAGPVVEEVFRDPSFLADGTVIDLFQREGRAEVFTIDAKGGLSHLGDLSIPRDARLLVSGDNLLEEIQGTEEYRVVPLGAKIGALRRPTEG